MIIFDNSICERYFESNNGYNFFVLGRDARLEDVYFLSAKKGDMYLGFFPLHKDSLKKEIEECSEFRRGSINQEALYSQLMFYENMRQTKRIDSAYFTCSIDNIFKIVAKTGQKEAHVLVPCN